MSTIIREIKMPVSKNVTKNGKVERENVGVVALFAPALSDFGLSVEPTGQDATTGELTYATAQDQFLYNSLLAAVKANGRNRLVSGSTTLRPGAKLPTTLEELVTPSENTSTVLADRRALFDYFKGYLAAMDKPDNIKRLLTGFLEKPELLALQPEDKRQKIKPYFEQFGSEVEERLNEWQADYLINVIAQCDAEEVDF